MESGKMLLHYRLEEQIGQGGMGIVWKALDTTLDRSVAIKVLSQVLSRDPERLARFAREARLLASLNHPHIAAIYGLHETDTQRFLAMEFIAGEDLTARLERGPLPVRDAIRLGLQIAQALEAAHEAGVVHRDLKPANIRLTSTGEVKVLDFGLAKAFNPAAPGSSSSSVSLSPTLTAAHTVEGVILGTAAYMSPEQAAGQPTDKRCDIWSFGVVLYEMLAGARLFQGETVSHTLADVLRSTIDWSRLPAGTPRPLQRLLERCLDRHPARRLRDIGEARIALQELDSGVAAKDRGHEPPVPRRRERILPWAVAGVAVLLAAVSWLASLRARAVEPPRIGRFTLGSPNALGVRRGDGRAIAISPDGRLVVNSGAGSNENLLYTRALDEFKVHPLQGTQGAILPVFSPQGRRLAFINSRGLWTVSLAGGPPSKLTSQISSSLSSYTWSSDGFIYWGEQGSIWQIADHGGDPRQVKVIDAPGPLRQPWALPQGAALLVKIGGDPTGEGRLHVLDLETGRLKDLGLQGTDLRYLPTGHLIYGQSGQIFVAGFNLEQMEVKGTPVPVLNRVLVEGAYTQMDVALNGTVVYLPRDREKRNPLVEVNRKGVAQPLSPGPLPFDNGADPRLSPDGHRLVVSGNVSAVWTLDLDLDTPTLISESGFYPLWSPDGESLLYGSVRHKSFDLYRRPADLSRPEELILDRQNNLRSAAWAPDGTLIFREEIPGKGMDLFVWPDLNDESSIAGLLQGPDNELAPAISPDGRWMAYVSDQSGRDEIYITGFPHPAARVQISSAGGNSPAWSPNGTELFYFQGNRFISAKLAFEKGPKVQHRQQLFEGNYVQYRWYRQYDVTPDGDHFIMIENPPHSDVEVILNWFIELKQQMPSRS